MKKKEVNEYAAGCSWGMPPCRPDCECEECRTQRYEEQGMTRSDAQAAVEAEDMIKNAKKK